MGVTIHYHGTIDEPEQISETFLYPDPLLDMR